MVKGWYYEFETTNSAEVYKDEELMFSIISQNDDMNEDEKEYIRVMVDALNGSIK